MYKFDCIEVFNFFELGKLLDSVIFVYDFDFKIFKYELIMVYFMVFSEKLVVVVLWISLIISYIIEMVVWEVGFV